MGHRCRNNDGTGVVAEHGRSARRAVRCSQSSIHRRSPLLTVVEVAAGIVVAARVLGYRKLRRIGVKSRRKNGKVVEVTCDFHVVERRACLP